MQTRALGKTGYSVGAIGFGGWGLAGDAWRGVDARDAQRALYDAIEGGLDFIDTALAYGNGASERLIGEVVRDLRARDRAVVATKVAPLDGLWVLPEENGAPDSDSDRDRDDPDSERAAAAEAAERFRRGRPLQRALPAGHVVASVEQSLRNLRLEALPLCQLGVWHDAWLDSSAWPELRGAMEQCVRAGKVLHWGIAADPGQPATATAVLAEPIVESVQLRLNVWSQAAMAALLPAAIAREVAVIVRSPFDEGALTGALTPAGDAWRTGWSDIGFPPGDWRAGYFRGDRLREVAERIQPLRAAVRETDEVRSLPELCLRFLLGIRGVGVVIPGMRRAAHVEANLAVADGRALGAALQARVAEQAWERNWYLP
jgi:aryl-alcohol dehydrogenase-like predicted oxidoreductase